MADISVMDAERLCGWLPRRARETHKGDFGRILLLCGAVGYTGAPALAAMGAARSGAGLIFVGVPEPVYPIVAGKLLDVFERFAEGNHLAFLSLEVRASNYAAIALYGQHGYRGVGRRRNYYEHPKEDAVIMTREFGEGAK